MWLPLAISGKLKLNDNPKHLVYAMKATGRSEALVPLLISLKADKLAPDDAAAVMAMAGDAANAGQAKEMCDLVNDPAMSDKVVGLWMHWSKQPQRVP
jgi:hypothetical protein